MRLLGDYDDSRNLRRCDECGDELDPADDTPQERQRFCWRCDPRRDHSDADDEQWYDVQR